MMNRKSYILLTSLFMLCSHSKFGHSLELTGEDYTHVMNTVGMSAPSGTITNFDKGTLKFEWTFHWAAVPFPPQGKIDLIERNNDSTIMKFQVSAPVPGPGYSPLHCEFTLRVLNGSISSALENTLKSSASSSETQTTAKIGSIEYFKEKFGSYPPKEVQRFKYGNFVLATLDPQYGFEGDRPDNTPTKKQDCQLTITNGLLYDKNGNLFSTNVPPKAFNDHGEFIWALSKKGKMYATTSYGELCKAAIGNQHSFFEKKDGFGKPIAGGGHPKADLGKITELDGSSGHFKPNTDQLLLSAYYLYTQGVFAENAMVYDRFANKSYTLEDISKINIAEILARYKEL